MLPQAVIYDSQLTMSMPTELSVASGLNALAHCIDALWAPRADPINAALAGEAIQALSQGLPAVAADGEDVDGRDRTLYGAYLAAMSFASAGSAMHNKICHALGGTFELPHAPHARDGAAVRAGLQHVPRPGGSRQDRGGLRQLHRARGPAAAGTGARSPAAALGSGLHGQGDPRGRRDRPAAIPADNPRPVTQENLRELLTAALNGDDPHTLVSATGATEGDPS